jgi:hypothetical protein
MDHCFSQVSTLKIFPAPLTVTVYTYLFGVIQVGILGAVFEGMPNFALTSFNELISVAYAVCMYVCVCVGITGDFGKMVPMILSRRPKWFLCIWSVVLSQRPETLATDTCLVCEMHG